MKNLVKVLCFVALASLVAGCSMYHRGMGYGAPGVSQYTSDSVITSKVKAKYAKDARLKSYGIGVSTNKGVVSLVGKLPDAQLKERAIDIAMRTKGVVAVDAKNLVTPQMLMVKKPKKVYRKKAMKVEKAPAEAKTGASTAGSTASDATTSTTTPMPAPVTPVKQY